MSRKKQYLFNCIICMIMAIAIFDGSLLKVRAQEDTGLPLLVDDAMVLTDDQYRELMDTAQGLESQYNFSVYLIIIDNIEGLGETIEDANEYIYDYFELGLGEQKDGLSFLISVNDRKFDVYAHGYGDYAFAAIARETMMDDYVVPHLRDNEWYEASKAYYDKCGEYLELAAQGKPYDGPDVTGKRLLAAVLLALITSVLMDRHMRKQLRSVDFAKEARAYETGAIALSVNEDYLSHVTTRVEKRSKSSSSSGGSRSSGSHTSGSF